MPSTLKNSAYCICLLCTLAITLNALGSSRIRMNAGREPLHFLPVHSIDGKNRILFWISRTEVTMEAWVNYLNDGSKRSDIPETLPRGLRKTGPRHWRVEPVFRKHPVSGISFNEAEAFCRWLSTRSGRTIRLPSLEEWQYAASAGDSRLRYPWGWSPPHGRCCFHTHQSLPVAHFEHAPNGLFDLAGNVSEWCAGNQTHSAWVSGGAWSDRLPESLEIHTAYPQDPSLRSEDIGFRILLEEPGAALQ